MPRLVDVFCPQNHVQEDLLLGDEIPDCPECGLPRKVWWGAGHATFSKVFQPVYHEGFGMITNEYEWKMVQTATARNMGCSPDQIQPVQESRSTVKTRADEARQRAYDRRRKRGLDEARVREIREAIARTGRNPYNGKVAPTFRKD